MYRRIVTLALIVWTSAFLFTPTVSRAQDEADVPGQFELFDLVGELGDSELMLQGATSISLDDAAGGNGGSVFASWGWFFRGNQQVGGKLVLAIQDDAKGGLDVAGAGGPFYRYNFLTGEISPFVGAGVLATFGDHIGGDVQLELEGGVRWFLNRNVAFSAAASLDYDVDANELSDVVGVRFGLSYFWR